MKINLILAGLLITISAFTYWYEFKNKPERVRKEEQAGKLFVLDPKAEVESLNLIDENDHVKVSMKCQKNCSIHNPAAQWEITNPIHFKADEGNVGSFISSISSIAITETIPLEGNSETQLSQYSLSHDKRENHKVDLKLKNQSQAYTIYFGEDTPVGDGVYVYVNGPGQPNDKIRIVPSYIKSNLKRGLTYWRDKHLLKFETNEVTGFKLINSHGVTEISRSGTLWFFTGKTQADTETVSGFLSALNSINIKDWVRVKLPTKYTQQITLKLSKNNPIVLNIYEVHQDKDKLLKTYATLNGNTDILEIEHSAAENLSKKPDNFRVKNILIAEEKDLVRQIQLTLEGKSYSFQSDDGTHWKLSNGSTLDQLNPEAINQALQKISNTKIVEFLGKKDISKDTIKFSAWTLKDKQGKPVHEFSFYKNKKTNKEEYYSRLPTGEFVKLESWQANQIPSKLTDFQTKLEANAKKAN